MEPTAAVPQHTAKECVQDALQVRYWFLECAKFYGNEEAMGEAIAAANHILCLALLFVDDNN